MRKRLWLLAGLVVLGIAVWSAYQIDFANLSVATTAERVRATGPLAPLVLLFLLVAQCVIAPLPSEPLMMVAGFLYGPRPGFVLSWLGVTLGACACFLLADLARPFAVRFVRAERLEWLDAQLGSRGELGMFVAVLFIRLFAFSSFDVVSYGCGLLRMRFRWFLLASAIGVMPKVFAFTYLGTSMSELPAWLGVLIAVGTFGILVLVPWILRTWRRAPGTAV